MTGDRSLTLTIVDALAAVEHSAPQELEYSLHEYVDTAALRALSSMDRTGWELTFSVPDHRVTVSGDGRIHVDGDLVREVNQQRQQRLQ